jgi:hypothetical protein
MDRLTGALIGVALLTLLNFARNLQRERRDVWNRGINQSPLVTLLKAFNRTLSRLILFGGLAYLVISGYYFYKFRQNCQRSDRGWAAYQQTETADHLREALTWPGRDEDAPQCLE